MTSLILRRGPCSLVQVPLRLELQPGQVPLKLELLAGQVPLRLELLAVSDREGIGLLAGQLPLRIEVEEDTGGE